MKKNYILLVLSFVAVINLRSQVLAGGFFEKFESMTVNMPPSGGWQAVGGFSVLGSPHGYVNGVQVNGLSKELYTNTGTSNCDSVISPKLKNMNQGLDNISFDYRICNWVGGVPTSTTTLNAGDTCYFTLYKYLGSLITQRTVIYKIHKGNHFQSGTNFVNVYSVANFFPFTYSGTDTIALSIKVKRGTVGDYWYDFDNILFSSFNGVKENSNTQTSIFPNPVKNDLSIKLNHDEALSHVLIRNSFGQEVLKQEALSDSKVHTIDLSSLNSGVYFAEIYLRSGQKTIQKVIKD